MFSTEQNQTQIEIDATTLRALVDWNFVCDPESQNIAGRRPFRLDTAEGAWTGAFLPDMAGAVAVRAEMQGDVISSHTRVGRDTSWLLRQVGIYAQWSQNVTETERRGLTAQERGEMLKCLGVPYQPSYVLSILRALGAPDARVGFGQFTFNARSCGLDNPQLLALSGTVARTPWRAFVLPVARGEQLRFFEEGGQ